MSYNNFSIIITISDATLEALRKSGYCLYLFRRFEISDYMAVPVVWCKNSEYLNVTEIECTDHFKSYISNSEIEDYGKIVVGNSWSIYTGEYLVVSEYGVGSVYQDSGFSDAISILNETSSQFTTGVASDNKEPLRAVPLYGHDLKLVKPTADVFLMFSGPIYGSEVVAELSTGPGVLVQGTPTETRALTFDINLGWTYGGAS